MSPIIIKIMSVAGMNLAAIIITKKILQMPTKLLTLRNILWFLVSLLPSFLFYSSTYDFTTFLTFFFLILALKKIFDIDISISTILSLEIMIISTVPDLICSAVMINFVSFEEMRNSFTIMFFTTTFISITTYYLFKIPIIKNITLSNIKNIQKPEKRRIIIYCLFAFIAICIAYYTASNLFIPTKDYLIVNIVILVLVFLIYIYMSEIIKYDKLLMQNNTLFECMKNVEDYQEQQDLKIHEYKNQLSKITAVTKDKKVINMLEEVLQVDLTTDNYILGQLKKLPKGDIKSLIYYKLLVANKKEINTTVDISPKIKELDFKLAPKINNELSQLLGIYFDNAIEAAAECSKKTISFEIYKIHNDLIFVIMNSYNNKINLNNINKKHFSTKGVGRGKGLYFAKKIIKHSTCFTEEHQLCNNYYIQKLIIKKE